MKSLWNDAEAGKFLHDPVLLRVYTSQLLGREPDLVLHGGGNTSVKIQTTNIFGEKEDVLFVKGSGWDLATIEPAGFAPVKMDALLKMAQLKTLSDSDMVKAQRTAMTDPYAPNPSVEAILHAIIPFKYVDHTHADAVVAMTNAAEGEKRIRDIYGNRVMIVPYVMPGFVLAKKVYDLTRTVDWKKLEGVILLNHGIFTFDNDARASYERMIRLVTEAEHHLNGQGVVSVSLGPNEEINTLDLARLRRAVSRAKTRAVLALPLIEGEAVNFSTMKNISAVATRGPLTPDHVIRTKRIPVVTSANFDEDVVRFVKEYVDYFNRNNPGGLTPLNPAPCWAVWPGKGAVCFGSTLGEARIVADIAAHTIRAITWAEALGGWKALGEKDLFDMEYWELEQAKLKKGGQPLPFQGKVALVTGAASGIGQACTEILHEQGAVVVALDIRPEIKTHFKQKGILGMVCDVTNADEIASCVDAAVRHFGGLDIVVSNAGTFPPSETIAELKSETWDKSINVNLTSHERLLKVCIPYLTLGIDPAIVIVGSKNVPAPGPGVSAYSVAKAGLTQLARVAALELAPKGIRVNVVHPNQVFDTAIWTPEVLEKRAKNYKMTVEEYKTSNLLKVSITSRDVAELVCAMAGPVFSKTTGAQIPIDGGNERVI